MNDDEEQKVREQRKNGGGQLGRSGVTDSAAIRREGPGGALEESFRELNLVVDGV